MPERVPRCLEKILILEQQRRFRVGLSFPNEYRNLAADTAQSLAKRYGKEQVLYDKYHKAEFAKPGLNFDLPLLYKKECDLIVVFLCKLDSPKF